MRVQFYLPCRDIRSLFEFSILRVPSFYSYWVFGCFIKDEDDGDE